MITSISIKNLRGIREGKLENLAPLTILVGPNNCGKSTVLDAIMIAASPEPQEALEMVLRRRVGLEEARKWFLWRHGRKVERQAELEVTNDSGARRRVAISRQSTTNADAELVVLKGRNRCSSLREMAAKPRADRALEGRWKGPAEVRLIDAMVFGSSTDHGNGQDDASSLPDLVTRAIESGLLDEASDLVRKLVPETLDIRILTTAKQTPVVQIRRDFGSLPEGVEGDGVRLLLRLALELAAPVGGLQLIEEPEVHMHPAAIVQVARAMWAAAARDIQLVVSTHSLDLIDLVLDAGSEKLDKIAVFSLVLENGELKYARRSGKDAQFARTEIEEDLR